MQDWTGGYVSNIDYTYGYYPELNPIRARLALHTTGIVSPDFSTACELGFGQGISINQHGAASTTEWWGTDFNPVQAGFAKELASTYAADDRLFDQAFEEFCQRQDLPDFDFIAMHGIWSWISDDNRRVIVDFIKRKLKVGGILYVSYNSNPGWATFSPMRELMMDHSQHMSASAHNIVDRINEAMEFASVLLETNPLYLRANPQVADRLKAMKEKNRHYLAHEYFNQDWHPMSFSRMNQWLGSAKLDFVSSAYYLDQIDSVNFTEAQLKFLSTIKSPTMRQSVKDFMANQQFRRDYWVKGPRRMGVLEQIEKIRSERIVLLTPPGEVKLEINSSQGKANMDPKVYNPILEFLADNAVHSIGELESGPGKKLNLNLNMVLQGIMVLANGLHVAPVSDAFENEAVRTCSKKLNEVTMKKARQGLETVSLASPVTGGGVLVNRIEQLFILCMTEGLQSPNDWVRSVHSNFESQGQKLVKESKAIDSDEETKAELLDRAHKFARSKLPILKAAGIVD